MATITLEVPDELLPQIQQLGDRFPEWLTLSLQQPSVPARPYREILGFLALMIMLKKKSLKQK